MNTMHNINKSQLSLLKRLKCDCPGIAQFKNILMISELKITTLFDRVLIVRYPMLLRASVLT